METNERETQINNKDIRHDLNGIAYLLKKLAETLAKIPNLPAPVDALLKGAIKTTEELIIKLRTSKKETENAASTKLKESEVKKREIDL